MAFRVPDTVFAPEHFGDGRKAPNCQIWVFFDCDANFCTTGSIAAEIVEVASNTVIARGTVNCTGNPTLHKFPLLSQSPLMAVIVQTRFKCGGDEDMENGDTERIWTRCA